MFFWLALLYSYQHTINAAPTPMVPVSHPTLSRISPPSPGNIPGSSNCPNLRSTWDIFWSCLSTIFLCAWVSVHSNIPPPGAKAWQVAIRRLELMFWTIIAPEMVILWAMRQWVGARRLAKLYKDDHPIWSKTHGYFLQMGGFMLFSSNEEESDNIQVGVLSPERLDELFKKRLIKFPTITEEEIEDRSKGDALSKTLVLGQTSWFITQCITRKAEGLDMTELELATLAFAALNGFMYFFWWNKPLDVRTTVPVYCLSTPLPKQEPESEETHLQETVSELPPAQMENVVEQLPRITVPIDRLPTPLSEREETIPGSPLQPTEDAAEQNQKRSWQFNKARARLLVFIKSSIDTVVAFFFRLDDMAEYTSESRNIRIGDDHVHPFYAMVVTEENYKRIAHADAVIGTIFGAIHAAGWNFSFPTPVEATIWEICSVVVTCGPFFVRFADALRYIYLPQYSVRLGSVTVAVADYLLERWNRIILGLYIIARIYLLTEALISLRDLPPGAFVQVQWTSYLPHI